MQTQTVGPCRARHWAAAWLVAAALSPAAAQEAQPERKERQAVQQEKEAGKEAGKPGDAALSRQDQQMMRDLMQANLAEIKMSALATAISQNQAVRGYAERMLNEHTAAKDALQKLADSRQIILPHGIKDEQVPSLRQLALMAGPDFDRTYLNLAGIESHRQAHELVERAASSARDPELKAFAAEQLPRIDKHLAMAEELAKIQPAQAAQPAPSGQPSANPGSSNGGK